MNMAALPLHWANCIELLKDRVNNRSFWEALEATRPVTIDGDTLVIGIPEHEYHRVGYIEQSSNMNAILRVVEERFGSPLKVRVIEGFTGSDWETAKARDQHLAAMRQAPAPRQTASRGSANSWDAFFDTLTQLYADSPNRTLPQGKARYANDALYALVDTMDGLYIENDEASERALARALDRVSGHAEMPATILAFELERLRAWRRSTEPDQPTE